MADEPPTCILCHGEVDLYGHDALGLFPFPMWAHRSCAHRLLDERKDRPVIMREWTGGDTHER